MNRVLISYIAIFTMLSCGQPNKIKEQENKNWGLFEGENFTIEYPIEWELNSSGLMGTTFILFSQLTSESDQFKENVNLMIQDLGGENISLNKYVEFSENQIKVLATDGVMITSKRERKNELEFHKLIYTSRQGIFELKYEQYCWIYNHKAYVLTFTSEINSFNDFKKIGEKILNSFEFLIK